MTRTSVFLFLRVRYRFIVLIITVRYTTNNYCTTAAPSLELPTAGFISTAIQSRSRSICLLLTCPANQIFSILLRSWFRVFIEFLRLCSHDSVGLCLLALLGPLAPLRALAHARKGGSYFHQLLFVDVLHLRHDKN